MHAGAAVWDELAYSRRGADCDLLQVFAGHSGPVTCGSFTPDGKAVCTASADGR